MTSFNTDQVQAKSEIDGSFSLCTYSMRNIGITLDKPQSKLVYLKYQLMIALSFFTIFYHIFSDVAFLADIVLKSPKVLVQDIVPSFHTFGYGFLSSAKLFALWYKKNVFDKLLRELVDIWPMPPLNKEVAVIKDKSLSALSTAHRFYFAINVYGVWFYYLTPVAIYCHELYWLRKADAQCGFIWKCWYPFDKHKTGNHVIVYLFEVLVGQICVWTCLGSDLLFTGMISHISMLLRIMHQRLTSLAFASSPEQNYRELIECIKLHQRLIIYCKEVDEAFSIANLVQIGISSINICCVLFVIVFLEPTVAVSNKLFLVSALFQIGVICFYADDIIHSNAEVAMSAYKSAWHKSDPRCRRALLFLIKRSQKEIAITAMNFANMDLNTYSGILKRSYSCFTLLYSMYSD